MGLFLNVSSDQQLNNTPMGCSIVGVTEHVEKLHERGFLAQNCFSNIQITDIVVCAL